MSNIYALYLLMAFVLYVAFFMYITNPARIDYNVSYSQIANAIPQAVSKYEIVVISMLIITLFSILSYLTYITYFS